MYSLCFFVAFVGNNYASQWSLAIQPAAMPTAPDSEKFFVGFVRDILRFVGQH
jgi:hypothetical protein